jgi:methyl-accepting chemotaxis protein
MTTDLTTEILKQIRDGILDLRQDFNERLDQTNARLDQTNERLDQTNTRLAHVAYGLEDLGKLMRTVKPSTSIFTPGMSSDWKGTYPT